MLKYIFVLATILNYYCSYSTANDIDQRLKEKWTLTAELAKEVDSKDVVEKVIYPTDAQREKLETELAAHKDILGRWKEILEQQIWRDPDYQDSIYNLHDLHNLLFYIRNGRSNLEGQKELKDLLSHVNGKIPQLVKKLCDGIKEIEKLPTNSNSALLKEIKGVFTMYKDILISNSNHKSEHDTRKLLVDLAKKQKFKELKAEEIAHEDLSVKKLVEDELALLESRISQAGGHAKTSHGRGHNV